MAQRNSSKMHVAIVEQLDGRSTERLEQVSDEQYNGRASVCETSASPSRAQQLMVTSHPSWRSLQTAYCSATSGRHPDFPGETEAS